MTDTVIGHDSLDSLDSLGERVVLGRADVCVETQVDDDATVCHSSQVNLRARRHAPDAGGGVQRHGGAAKMDPVAEHILSRR